MPPVANASPRLFPAFARAVSSAQSTASQSLHVRKTRDKRSTTKEKEKQKKLNRTPFVLMRSVAVNQEGQLRDRISAIETLGSYASGAEGRKRRNERKPTTASKKERRKRKEKMKNKAT
jgi:hypothetical protein